MDFAESRRPDIVSLFRRAPVRTVIAGITFVNWFVYFGVTEYCGGNAIGTRPSVDGFVLLSHGKITQVSETLWLSFFIYSFVTFAMTPIAVFLFILAYNRVEESWMPLSVIVTLFGVWAVLWYQSLIHKAVSSLADYFAM